ncbi:MAG: bifunctional UDP-N-acetylglucosamine diphosphorylase/glucosamine-1-phosphate N-acetyltransferase GlmU [Nitrospiraceae bacterium]|nr:MAG: bifunctional UDP-N-acetylglucosamine diphosphorylase/glucosamine-1-phosphate N-acetyltransferase GlmU [Nitrospiraceae bacterium]
MKKLAVIVLAAGQGTRMRSKLAKVLHSVCGRPMASYAADLAEALARGRVAVVVGHQAEKVKDLLADRKIDLVVQARQLGTGHAVTQAQSAFQGRAGNAWSGLRFVILSGDTPLLTEATVRALLAAHERERATVSLLTAHLDRPVGYGRIVRGRDGSVWKIIEDKDASPSERRLTEVNAGTYVVEGAFLFPALAALKPANAQKEYYLTDIVEAAIRQGKKVTAYIAANPVEALGINTRAELAEAERVLRGRVRQRLMEAGVTFLAPETSFVDAGVKIGRDSVIHPHVTLESRTVIGEDCVIRSHSRLVECALGDGVTVLDGCVIEGSRLEGGCRVGPFAHLRPGTIVGRNARVGNFVELKKTDLGEGSKANHLSYLGDARIGKRVNVGAGTITCNYDGVNKHQTVIGDDVFVGSDVSLVAPVTVGRGAMIGAGSVVTQDVAADALAIGRARQVVKPGWVKGWRDKMKKGKR